MFEFRTTKTFNDDLKRLEEQANKIIKEKIEFLLKVENPLFYSKKLKGYKDIFRFRTGNFRILFQIENNILFFLRVSHRKDIYKKIKL